MFYVKRYIQLEEYPDLDDNMWNPSSCLMDGDTTGCNHGYDFFHDKPTPLPNI